MGATKGEVPLAANVQSGQQRFTVVKLPVLQIVLESLVLPFRHLPELVKYGWIPFAGSVAARLLDWLLLRYFAVGLWSGLFMVLAHFALFIPFSVVWTTITIEGSSAALPERPFAYGRVEWRYAAAVAAMLIVAGIVLGLPMSVYRHGQEVFSYRIEFLGGLFIAAGATLAAVGFVRFAFVFPAIVIGRYRGIGPAWRQTAGNLEGLALVIILAIAPYEIVDVLIGFGQTEISPGVAAATAAFVQMLMVAMSTTAGCSAPALAYKWIVMGQGRTQAGGTAVVGN